MIFVYPEQKWKLKRNFYEVIEMGCRSMRFSKSLNRNIDFSKNRNTSRKSNEEFKCNDKNLDIPD